MAEDRQKRGVRSFNEAIASKKIKPFQVFTGHDASVMDFGDELPDPAPEENDEPPKPKEPQDDV